MLWETTIYSGEAKMVWETRHLCILGDARINILQNTGRKTGESRVLDILHTRREQRQVCDELVVIYLVFPFLSREVHWAM